MALSFLFLALCLIVLFLGPLLNPLVAKRPRSMDFLDGFVLTAVLALVSFHILPHAIEAQGFWVIGIAFAGMMLPTLIERLGHRFAAASHKTTLGLAILGLMLHMFADGVALVQPGDEPGLIPLAVFLHSIPMGLLIWWIIRPITTPKTSFVILLMLALALLAGFGVGLSVVHAGHPRSIGWFEGLVTGSLLHVMFHRFAPPVKTVVKPAAWQWASGLGCLTAVALVVLINPYVPILSHSQAWGSTARTFLSLALMSAPALLLAYLAGGLVQVFLPKSSLGWLRSGSQMTRAFTGRAVGLPLPVCSCGVVPLSKSLINRGTPLAAAIAFFVATPELGFDAILISLPLLGTTMMFIRLFAAAIVALLVGWLIGLLFPEQETPPPLAVDPKMEARFAQKLRLSFESAFGEIVDHTGPWILVGLLLAAFVQPLLENIPVHNLSSFWQVPIFALIGMPIYVCASGSTPFVAALLVAGISPGAALAFLITGPATNVTTFGILTRLHNKKVALTFMALMFVIPVAIGYAVNLIFPTIQTPDIFAHQHDDGSLLQKISLAALALVFVALLLRKGPRHLINQIVSFEDEDNAHNHDHAEPSHKKAAGAKPHQESCCH